MKTYTSLRYATPVGNNVKVDQEINTMKLETRLKEGYFSGKYMHVRLPYSLVNIKTTKFFFIVAIWKMYANSRKITLN